MAAKVKVSADDIAKFCKTNRICKFALFGSVLRDDFSPDSDIDVLVEFEPDSSPGLIGLSRMEQELSSLFGGRRVDLNTVGFLSPMFRAEVLSEAVAQYVSE